MKIKILVQDGLIQRILADAPADVELFDLDTTEPNEYDITLNAWICEAKNPDLIGIY